ncbi:hypothetical protein BVH01_01465 [Pseudomonas sp. PA1(2017)]|uniref:hypothetical protein n=1 Tax=Pseudomonas sp. PA1(2017) TaxID=1932113 RepID=UPI0009678471|nr:hypothetical protein [Pseudomonas sp. PA1(2017)]OLU20637.1 hypothetical protein BVH01_01465 [Pseudomonas sp. PA1(2017)]
MFAELKDKELHLHGSTSELNAVARSIHRGRHGASSSFELCSENSLFSSLQTECYGKLSNIQIEGYKINISYSEFVKNRLYTYFSMPSGTPQGALFFLTYSNQGHSPLLVEGSLELFIHVAASDT